MTMMVKTLVALDAPGDWTTWNLGYYDHTDLMGEISGPAGDSYYGPPKQLAKTRGVRVIDIDVGFVVAELDHATLLRFWGPAIRVQEAFGRHGPGQGVGKRLDELPDDRLYAVTWLEVY